MSRGDDEVDRMRHKSRIACAHQLLGYFTFTSSVDDWPTTAGKVRTGTTRAALIIFTHGYSLHRFCRLRRPKTDAMMRFTLEDRTMLTTRTSRLTLFLVLMAAAISLSLLNSPHTGAAQDNDFQDELDQGKLL